MTSEMFCQDCKQTVEPDAWNTTKNRCRACIRAYHRAYYLAHTTIARSHRNAQPSASILERLAMYTLGMDSPQGCWLWQGTKDAHDGYGYLTIKGKKYKTHILMWKETHGPIPEGLYVVHNCPGGDKKPCINPQHLYLGSFSENIKDAYRKKQRSRATLRIPDEEIPTIKRLATSLTQKEIATMYNVHPSHICKILQEKRRTFIP